MDKVQLVHPEGKQAISMQRSKYDMLCASLLDCLKIKQPLTFKEILDAVAGDLKKKKLVVQGKLEWNLFWVTLDLVAKNKINKDRSVTPILYTILPAQ